MKQQELIWIGFPYSDFSEQKVRPALIVSNNNYNSKHEDLVICAVTTTQKQTDYSVNINQKNLSSGKLPIQSRIKADKIMQVSKKLALKAFGKLGDKKFSEVTNQVKKLIGSKEQVYQKSL